MLGLLHHTNISIKENRFSPVGIGKQVDADLYIKPGMCWPWDGPGFLKLLLSGKCV